MPKIKLEFESDLSQMNTAFASGDAIIDKSADSVKAFGKDAKTAYSGATTEANKFSTEVKNGTKQVGELNKSTELVGKSGNRLKELKQEIKELTGEAIKLKQQGDITGSNEAIKQVGHLKDELKDIQDAIKSVSGNLKENFTNAIGKATSIGAQGYEAVAAAQGIVGVKNEDIEKQLLKLQSIQSLARIASEFGDIGDRLTEIKIGFAPVTNAFKTFYNSANDGLLNLKKNGFNFSGLLPGIKGFFSTIGSGFKSFFTSTLSGAKALYAALAANPFAIVLIVITAVIGAMVALKDKIKPIGELFDAIGDAISYVGDKLEELGQFFGIVASESEKANQKIIDNSKEQIDAIKKRYDFEIQLAEAAGGSTKEKEKQKTQAVLEGINATIVALKLKSISEGKLEKEDLERYKELQNERVAVIQESTVAEVKERTEAAKAADEARKKEADEAKKQADKLKAIRKDLADFLLDLAKKSNAAEIELLDGEEKIFAQRKAAQDEIDLLRETLVKKQVAAGKGNKIAAEQQAEFANLELLANKQQADALLKLQVDRANKEAALHRKETDDEIKFLDTKTKLAIAQVEGMKNTTGLSEADFEKQKQIKILEIQKQAAQDSLELKKEQIAQTEGLTKQQIEEEQDLLVQETKNLSDKLDAEIKKLQEKPKFSLAKLLGLTPEEFEKVKQGIGQFIEQAAQLADSFIADQQQQLDTQLEANQKLIDSRQQNIDDLKSQLANETDLQKQGLANNVDNIKQQIAAQQAQRQQDLVNQQKIQQQKKQLAKEQFISDTITQSVNLLTASTEIFKSYSAIPFIGIPLAIGLIGTMIGAFIKTKANAYAAINAGAGFKEGGYTGGTHTNEERGVVHGQEFVHTADDTKKYRNLFEGIHKEDKLLIHQGILDLLDGQGIVLQQDLPSNLAGKKDSLRMLTNNTHYINTNKGLEERIDKLNTQVAQLTHRLQDKTTVLPDGTVIEKKGNITRKIKGK